MNEGLYFEKEKLKEDEGKVLKRMKNLMCVVRKMSSVGRSGKGRRWRISWRARIDE